MPFLWLGSVNNLGLIFKPYDLMKENLEKTEL